MITEISLEEAVRLKNLVPEMRQTSTVEELQQRLGNHQYLCLGYFRDNVLVAFKLGYALDQQIFYSWLGAVLPHYRQKGIARELLKAQETWCREQGFKAIEVKSMNLFKPMLRMLLANGYHITGFSEAQNVDEHKIHFTKSLVARL